MGEGEAATASAPSQRGAACKQSLDGFFFSLEAVTSTVTCVGFPQGCLGGLGRWWCLRAIAMETAELLKVGLVSAANRCATSAGNQAQESLAKRSVLCADRPVVSSCGCATLVCFVVAPGRG